MSKVTLPRKGWTPARVREHLQNAVYLEMWTVPLYLTGAYSLDTPVSKKTHRPEFASVPTTKDGKPDFAKFDQKDYNQYAFNNILSVAIQEMLHVELAANLLNAVRPKEDESPVTFTGKGRDPKPPRSAPQYDAVPACLADAKLPRGVKLKIGGFDENAARLFQWIETDVKLPPKYDVEAWHASYTSIGHFYTSLKYGMKACWEDLYPKGGRDSDPFQRDDWETAAKMAQGGRMLKAIFMQPTQTESKGGSSSKLLQQVSYKDFSIKIYGSPDEALVRAEAAMTAITVQGEGAGGSQEIPKKFQPTGDPEDDIEIGLDRVSHYERFTELVGLVKDKKFSYVQPVSSPDPALYAAVLNQSFSSFLMSLNDAFSAKGNMSIGAMAGLGNRTLQAWENNVAGKDMYQWESPDKYNDPTGKKGYHACQGLDPASKGANATCALMSDGKTASAFYHTCATTNMCKGQGGCGLAVTQDLKTPPNWMPAQNECKGQGGCGVPIPDAQVFNADPSPQQGGLAPADLQNKNVWEHAREVLKYTTAMQPSGERQSLTPTSPFYKPKK